MASCASSSARLRFLVATLDGTADRSQVGQDFALGDLSSGRRHALWARDDAAGEHGLHPTAGFRIGMTWPFNSTVAASSAIRTGWVRKPSWRCTGFGTNRLPSANRCGAAVTPVVPTADTAAGAFFLAS
jgi:hypothetical protein